VFELDARALWRLDNESHVDLTDGWSTTSLSIALKVIEAILRRLTRQ
jgi:hypothetical protein